MNTEKLLEKILEELKLHTKINVDVVKKSDERWKISLNQIRLQNEFMKINSAAVKQQKNKIDESIKFSEECRKTLNEYEKKLKEDSKIKLRELLKSDTKFKAFTTQFECADSHKTAKHKPINEGHNPLPENVVKPQYPSNFPQASTKNDNQLNPDILKDIERLFYMIQNTHKLMPELIDILNPIYNLILEIQYKLDSQPSK